MQNAMVSKCATVLGHININSYFLMELTTKGWWLKPCALRKYPMASSFLVILGFYPRLTKEATTTSLLSSNSTVQLYGHGGIAKLMVVLPNPP
jgi:hypothetical protein